MRFFPITIARKILGFKNRESYFAPSGYVLFLFFGNLPKVFGTSSALIVRAINISDLNEMISLEIIFFTKYFPFSSEKLALLSNSWCLFWFAFRSPAVKENVAFSLVNRKGA